ncbi:MAG: hypothetical protein ABI650_07370 [Dokdonella sp.]
MLVRIKRGSVDPMMEQMVERVLERAGQQLAMQIERDEPQRGVDDLVAGQSPHSHTLRYGTVAEMRRRQKDAVGFSCNLVGPHNHVAARLLSFTFESHSGFRLQFVVTSNVRMVDAAPTAP